MPRARDPSRDKAFEIYMQYNGKIDLVEIASQLNLPAGTVRGWKAKDKWEQLLNGTLQKNTERSKRNKGGQPGNKNALNAGAPTGNKNNLQTGEFERLFFDTLDQDEHEIIKAVPIDKTQLLIQEIQLLTVRERRMLRRIEDLKLSGEETIEDDTSEEQAFGKAPSGMTVVKYSTGFDKGKATDLKEFQGVLGQIQSIEDALTRVQARKQRAIETLHKFGFDDARLEIELMKVELGILKQDNTEPEIEDDGFLDALNAGAKDIWGEQDD